VPYGNQIVKAIDATKALSSEEVTAGEAATGMASSFGAVAAGGVAILAIGIASVVSYLGQFRDVAQQAEQVSGGLKNVWAELGHSIVDGGEWDKIKEMLKGNFAGVALGAAAAYNQGKDITKQIQDVRNLNEVNDLTIQKLQGQADRYRAQAKDVILTQDQKVAKLKEAEKIETDIINRQQANAQKNIDTGIALANKYGKVSGGDVTTLKSGSPQAIQLANDLAQNGKIVEAGYELLMQGYQRQTQAMNAANMKLIRQQNDEARAGLKGAKELNNDELELQRSRLTGEKEAAKLILDNDAIAYETRLKKLKEFVQKSKDIIKIENEIADREPGISGFKIQTNAQNANNQNAQVDNYELNQTQAINNKKLQDEKDYKTQLLKQYKELEESKEELIQDGLNTELLNNSTKRAKDILDLSEKYEKGIVLEKEYRSQIQAIRKRAEAKDIDIEISALQKIQKVQEDNISNGAVTPKQLQETKNRIVTLQNRSTDLKSESAAANSKGGIDGEREKAKEAVKFSGELVKGLEIADGLMKSQAEAKIEALEQEFALIQRNGEAEKTRIGDSILSSKEKAREQRIVDAQVAQERIRITQQENEVKQKQAEFDKATSIARIIQETAVAYVAALTLGPILGIPAAAIVAALGAAQLAVAIATPLPKFFKGTKNAPEGLAHVGERGTELQINPDGRMELTPNKDTVKYLQKGTQIIPHHELMAMFAKPEQINYLGGTFVDNKKLEKLMQESNDLKRREKRTTVVKVMGDRFGTYANRNY
jgi:hypothetical protein